MTDTGIKIDGTLDAQTDLLDRQIVSSDGRMIAKIDDIELQEHDGRLVVSGFLVGPGALAPRLGGALGALSLGAWSRLARREPGDPRRVDYTHVRAIATVVTVDHDREDIEIDGLERWTRERIIKALPGSGSDPEADPTPSPRAHLLEEGPPPTGPRHRFTRLAHMNVRFSNGETGDRVTDARLAKARPRGHLPSLVIDGLIVGRNKPGTLFGYDRDPQRGPWIIQMILRRVHRHTGYVAWTDIDSIDWDDQVIVLRTDELQSLQDL